MLRSLMTRVRVLAGSQEKVVSFLMRLPPAEVAAKRRALLRVRRHFFYHADTSRAGAVRQLIRDVCTQPTVTDAMQRAIDQAQHVRERTENERAAAMAARA